MASSTSFAPQTFAKLSPHPFLLANLQPPHHAGHQQPSSSSSSSPPPPSARANGRAPQQPRPVRANLSSLSHAHGSALVRIGDTSVLCGVRGELLPVAHIPQWRTPRTRAERETLSAADIRAEGAAEMRDYDLLVPNIELATGCAPQFLPGVPPTTLAQTLSTRVFTLLHGNGADGLLDVDDLRVWYSPPDGTETTTTGQEEDEKMADDDQDEGAAAAATEPELKAYWTLYIDVLFLSFDGNPFDAAWVAILAALRDTQLPKAWWDADREMVLCSRAEKKPLRVTGLPVATTAVVVTEKEKEAATELPQEGEGGNGSNNKNNTWILVDPDRSEEAICEESITVVVDRSRGETRIRGISKNGGRVLGPGGVREVVGLAEKRWEEVAKVLLT